MRQSPQLLGGCHRAEDHALKNRSAGFFHGEVGGTIVFFCVVLLDITYLYS